MEQNEVCTTFDDRYCINGVHCSVEEAQLCLDTQGYEDVKVIGVEHRWATWGRLPQEFDEPGITNGWWVVSENSSYKHKKKMTFVVTEEYKRIEAAIQQHW